MLWEEKWLRIKVDNLLEWINKFIVWYIYIYIYIYICIYPIPQPKTGCDTRSFFKQSKVGLISEFSFSLADCLTKSRELSLPNYLTIAGGGEQIPRLLVWREMKAVLGQPRSWTQVANSIHYNANHLPDM